MTTLIHDVLIVGAGPAGLAVAARLREPTPSALFTDAEHDRYQWIKKYSGRMNLRPRKPDARRSKCSSTCHHNSQRDDAPGSEDHEFDIKVLDSSGCDWLRSWKKNFAALGISHLRSPMFFHPCPRDRDGLIAFARETGRCDDCVEIANCVGKSMSKYRRKKKTNKGHSVGSANKTVLEIDERDRKDYFTPSAEIFHDYCEDVVHRYSLEDLVEHRQVTSIDFGFHGETDLHNDAEPRQKLFKITTTGGVIKFAKVVVLAVGAGGTLNMPRQLSEPEKHGACHSTQLANQVFLTRSVGQKILARKRTTVVVVGGGLTSAQIADKCIKEGVSQVFMIMRTGVKQRLEILLKARNGGSITPRYFKKLQSHITRGALSIHIHTNIKDQVWDEQRGSWHLEAEPPIPELPREVDYIYYATGVKPDVESLPFLAPLREKALIDVKGGMPCLTDDLAWAKDVPLFVAGRLAGLRIGPDCGNLEGARAGAERIAWVVEEMLERQKEDRSLDGDDSYHRLCQRVGGGSANMYESLEVDPE